MRKSADLQCHWYFVGLWPVHCCIDHYEPTSSTMCLLMQDDLSTAYEFFQYVATINDVLGNATQLAFDSVQTEVSDVVTKCR